MQRDLAPLSCCWQQHRASLCAALIGFAVLVVPASMQAADYFIDGSFGDDANDGGTEATAWRTIARVNGSTFQPGDRVLFRGGQVHSGNLIFMADDSGTVDAPVTIGSYGAGRARLHADGGDGIYLSNTSYVTIESLDVTGPGWNTRNDGSRGVVLTGTAHHCVVEQVTVSGFHKAGLRMESATHDNAVTFVTAEQNGYIGLHISGDYQLVSDCRALSNHGDLTVTGNWSGSGILVDDASYVTVEYSEAAYNGSSQPWTGNGPVGIWCWNADHVTFRRCISHHNMRGQGNADGGGFDLDGGTTNSLIEHCYSYNNTGPGFMVYNFKWQSIPNRNNTIRYCVSENDAQGGVFLGTSGVALENIEVHNVAAFNTNGARVFYNSSGTKRNVNVRNCVFLTTGKLTINGNGVTLQGNCYYSASGSYSFGSYGGNFPGWAAATGDEMYNGTLVGLKTNPQLIDVGNGTKLTDPRQLTTLRSYSAVSELSPVINAGLDLPALFGLATARSDLAGAAMPIAAFDMGAFEYHPAPPPDITPPALTLSSPAEGSTVSGQLLIRVEAADEAEGSGLAGVRFQFDGLNVGDEVTAEPYSVLFDTTAVANGVHTLNVVARDAAGNEATVSASITVDNTSAPSDTIAPFVAISDPTDGAIVSGTFAIHAEALDDSDGSGIAGVRFLLDGASLGEEIRVAPYVIHVDTTGIADGPHTLSAVARDEAGNTAFTDVGITVANPTALADTIAPTIEILTPGDGSTVSGIVVIQAETVDESGGSGVAGVQFQLDGVDVGGELTNAPYSLSWDTATVTDGQHILSAAVRDGAGNMAVASVTVIVSNQARSLAPFIQDNTDPNGVTISPGWTAATSVSGYHGTNYLAATAGSKSVRFSPDIPHAGYYEVHLRWTAHTNRATNAPVDINHSGGVATFALNMRSNGGTWVKLGTFWLEPGGGAAVTVRADGANGYVIADAVQFVPQ